MNVAMSSSLTIADRCQLQRNLRWMISLRIILYSLFLGISLLLQPVSRTVFHVSLFSLGMFIASVYIVSIISLMLVHNVRKGSIMIHFEALFDVLCAGVLVIFSGGSQSIFVVFFFFPIISGSFMLPGIDRYLPATLATFCYGAVLFLEHKGWIFLSPITAVDGLRQDPMLLLHSFAIRGITFFTVALLTKTLTQRLKRTEAALTKTSRDFGHLTTLYHQIFTRIPTGIITISEQRITSFNPAAEAITGISRHQVDGRMLYTLFPDIFPLAAPASGTFDYTKPDHSAARIEYILSSLTEHDATAVDGVEDDPPGTMLLTIMDVSEKERNEAEMRQKEKMAAIGEMAAGVAHEIRNPLAAISGSIQMLAKEAADDRSQRLFTIMKRESNRLEEVITDFLNFSKPASLKKSWFSLKEITEEAAATLRNHPRLPQTCHFAIDIPEGLQAYGDPEQIRRVLLNLVHNSCMAFDQHGGTVRVSATGEDGGGNTLVSVLDNGCGIAPEDSTKIFEPFFTTRENGTGLGLAIVRQTIENHGGRISVTSVPGKETSVTFTLPRPAQPA